MDKLKTPVQPDDRGMILNPDQWPSWPCLPLKRRNNSLEDKNLGLLIATQEHADAVAGKNKFQVFHVYMFKLPKTGKDWDAIPRTEYSTVEDLLRDGWMVD